MLFLLQSFSRYCVNIACCYEYGSASSACMKQLSLSMSRKNICVNITYFKRHDILMAACVKIIVLWNVTPCNLVDLPTFLKDLLPQYLKMEIVRHFKTYVHARILKLEAACSSDELVNFYQIVRRHISDTFILIACFICRCQCIRNG